MKKILLPLCLLLISATADAQFDVLKRAKEKAQKKVNDKISKKADDTVDGAMDKTEKKNNEEKNKEEVATNYNPSSGSSTPASGNTGPSFKAYSKYDFVPGEKVIGFEDFSTGNIGDFPAGWNTSGSGEIVTVEGKPGRWLWLTKPGVFVPEFTEKFPEDFTFEFDLLHGVPTDGTNLNLAFVELLEVSQPQHWTLGNNRLTVGFSFPSSKDVNPSGASEYTVRKNSVVEAGVQVASPVLIDKNNPVHISISRQKERMRVYTNQEKIWDIPKALAKDVKLNAIVFSITNAGETVQQYIGNLRLAVGAPDTRNKMLTQNKWVTHGILFDVNSATIKPESYGTLKEMANLLKEYADLKIKIVGHTDSDGKDDDNLDLSKRRASSIKESLEKEFGIDAARIETDGKGESEPIDKNDSAAGKANNRRVEFIRL